uniref:BPTI/Kunitz inhibitor domain-containing protein n=1 Tax=Otus sunia TaxID=257818 RepID=A0A8C8E6F2_9STRI
FALQPAPHSPADSCRLSRDPGPCSGMLSRFFYNSSSMACETFLYGGCLGNGNNFYSEKECLQYCGAPPFCICQTDGGGGRAASTQRPAGGCRQLPQHRRCLQQ